MKTLKQITEQQQASRPTYFEDPEKDRLIELVLELAEEICVLRDRLDSCQRLAASGQGCTSAELDNFQPDDELLEQRLQRHTRFYEGVMKKMGHDPKKHDEK